MAVKFALIGAGKVGCALAKLLTTAGYEFVGAADLSVAAAQAACALAGSGRAGTQPSSLTPAADLVFITTPDEAIGPVCESLAKARAFRSGAVVAHCGGALPSEALAPARELGCSVGSLHPMQSFATVEQAVRLLPGAYCTVEGDGRAVSVLRDVAEAIGCRAMPVDSARKPLYHAATVMACNYLVALQDAALSMAEAAGLDRADALRAFLPLIKGTVDNLERVGLPDCLTGPIARGDVDTVRRHLEAVGAATPELLPLYRALGLRTIRVALAKGSLAEGRAAALEDLLTAE